MYRSSQREHIMPGHATAFIPEIPVIASRAMVLRGFASRLGEDE
jgi:hypothetical protein